MREDLGWALFLMMCFAVLGLTGLFASYGPQIPLERALARLTTLDQVQAGINQPATLTALRNPLGPLAADVLDGQGLLIDRIAAARTTVQAEAVRESASVARRVRLMLLSISILAGLFGTGVMLFALKQVRRKLGAA